MGTVSQLQNRIRSPAHRIQSEDEALEIARTLAPRFAAAASDRDINRLLPYDDLDQLWQSGLAAIAIPAEQGGLDVPNMLLAEIVTLIAEGDPSIGECLAVHFQALEGLRDHDNEDLKNRLYARVLEGDRFASAVMPGQLLLEDEKIGLRLEGQACSTAGLLYADWIVATSANGAQSAFIATESNGLSIVDDWDGMGQRVNGAATVYFDATIVEAGSVIRHSQAAMGTTKAMAALLQAAVDLGIARAALADYKIRGKTNATAFGQFALQLDMLSGAMETAGRKLDTAEVNTADEPIYAALYAASAIGISTSAAALEISSALFDLPAGAGGIGLNLDRHWRNARVRANGSAREPLLKEAAAYYGSSLSDRQT